MNTSGKWSQRKAGLALLAGMLCVAAIFASLGEAERGWAAATLWGPMSVVVGAEWNRRREPWFCATIAVLAAATIPVIVLVPWNALRVKGPVFFLIALLDYTVVYASVVIVDKTLHKMPNKQG